jgi:hypothetical protein
MVTPDSTPLTNRHPAHRRRGRHDGPAIRTIPGCDRRLQEAQPTTRGRQLARFVTGNWIVVAAEVGLLFGGLQVPDEESTKAHPVISPRNRT